MPGPPPKKDSERTRRAEPASGAARHGELRPVKIPPVDRNWHKRAQELYKSLKTSGQADYYQDSDWAYARILCDYLTRWYERGGAMDGANIETMMSKLGMTEGARRQTLRVELDLPEDERPDAELVAIGSYQNMLGIAK